MYSPINAISPYYDDGLKSNSACKYNQCIRLLPKHGKGITNKYATMSLLYRDICHLVQLY